MQQDPRTPLPLRQHVRPGTDRVSLGVVAVTLDDLARDDAGRRRRQNVGEVVVGVGQVKAHRVPIDDFEPRNLGVVIEAVAIFFGQRFLLVQADDLAGEQEAPRRAIHRIDETLDRIDDVVRDELALVALEGGVRGKMHTFAQMERVRLAAVADFGHRFSQHRRKLDRLGEVIVGEQALENDFFDQPGIDNWCSATGRSRRRRLRWRRAAPCSDPRRAAAIRTAPPDSAIRQPATTMARRNGLRIDPSPAKGA